jgi:hypothetical protein
VGRESGLIDVVDRKNLTLKFRVTAHSGAVTHLTIVNGCLFSLGNDGMGFCLFVCLFSSSILVFSIYLILLLDVELFVSRVRHGSRVEVLVAIEEASAPSRRKQRQGGGNGRAADH